MDRLASRTVEAAALREGLLGFPPWSQDAAQGDSVRLRALNLLGECLHILCYTSKILRILKSLSTNST